MLYYKNDLPESGAVRVIERKIDDGVASIVHGGDLLQSAETAAHSRSKYYQSRRVHMRSSIIILPDYSITETGTVKEQKKSASRSFLCFS
jgi:hypothetical protein